MNPALIVQLVVALAPLVAELVKIAEPEVAALLAKITTAAPDDLARLLRAFDKLKPV